MTKNGKAPEPDQAKSIVESDVNDNKSDNDLKRLQRLNKWLKENWHVVSVLGITMHHC